MSSFSPKHIILLLFLSILKTFSFKEHNMSLQSFKSLVKSNKIVIVGSTYCPYTMKALKLAEELDSNTMFIEREKELDLFAELKKETGQSTVPVVYYGGKYVKGGCSGFVELVKKGGWNGELENLEGEDRNHL